MDIQKYQQLNAGFSGSAQGHTRVKVNIHCRFAIFDEEEWRLITMTCGHFDHATQYTDLFAASCGSIGDFTDVKKHADDTFAIPPCRRVQLPTETTQWRLVRTGPSF